MTALKLERLWPYVASLAVLLVWWKYGASFPKNADPLMGASGTVASVLVGFLGTAKAIVLGLTGSRVFKVLKETGYHTVLFSYLAEALLFGVLLLVVSVMGFFLPDNRAPLWFGALWVLIASLAVFLYARAINLLFLLVRRA